jgi:hypothetical protein
MRRICVAFSAGMRLERLCSIGSGSAGQLRRPGLGVYLFCTWSFNMILFHPPAVGTPQGSHSSSDSHKIDVVRNNDTLPITWKHRIFNYRMPCRYKNASRLWVLLKGAIVWMLWIERNEAAFDGVSWSSVELRSRIWMCLIDYSRVAWQKLIGRCKKSPNKKAKAIEQLRGQWCKNSVFATWITTTNKPQWKLIGPGLSLGR